MTRPGTSETAKQGEAGPKAVWRVSARKIFFHRTQIELIEQILCGGYWIFMRVRIFTLKFHAATEQFDETDVQEFITDKEVLSIREHFFVKHETPYLVLIVTYLPGSPTPVRDRKKREAWRELLSDEQLPLFNSLREWRNERAKTDGVPSYVICTNLQLAQIVVNRPASLADLGKIQGLGTAKLEKYGQELLALLKPGEEPSQTHAQAHLFDEETRKESDERKKE